MQLMMDLCKEGILGTWVTVDEIQQKCIELFGENAKFGANHTMKSIGDGRGFMSKMILLTPDWYATAPEAPKELIVKISSTRQMAEIAEMMQAQGLATEDFFPTLEAKQQIEEMVRAIHNNECTVYEIFEETNMTDAYQPKIYHSTKFSEENRYKGYIIMEYIPNAVPLSLYDNISPELLEIPLRAIARIQAASVNWTDDQRSRLQLNPFDSLYPQMLTKKNVDKFQLSFRQFGGERLLDRAGQIDKIVDDLIDFPYYRNLDASLGMKPVFSHGDLWSTNIIWQKKTPESELNVGAIIDYQTSHIGSAVVDPIKAMCACLSGEDRRNHWEKLLEAFYDELRNHLKEEELPYTLEQLKDCYRRFMPLGGFIIFPMIGPMFQMYAANANVETKDTILELIMDKTECLIDDVLFYNKRNREIKKKEAEKQKNGTA